MLFSKVASSLCAGGYFVATVPDPSRSGDMKVNSNTVLQNLKALLNFPNDVGEFPQ